MHALLGKKLKMTQLWNDKGEVMGVTVIQAGPCQVIQVKSKDTEGRVQRGPDRLRGAAGAQRRQGNAAHEQAAAGHFKKHSATAKRFMREVR